MNISYSTWTPSSVSLSSPRLPESLSFSFSVSLFVFAAPSSSSPLEEHMNSSSFISRRLVYVFTDAKMSLYIQMICFCFVYQLPAFNNNMRKIHLHECEYCFLGIYYTVRVKWLLCCMLTSALMCEIWRKNHQCPDDQIHFYSEQQRLFSIP